MSLFLIIIHIVASLALILIVLLQTGKGADIGAAFGGGASQTIFGSQGAGTFLGKLTAIAAIIFMLTSLGLNLLSSNRIGGGSVMEGVSTPLQQEAPALPDLPKDQSQPAQTGTEEGTE
jgi:preprotein translocase subunit SecG